jgi:predicted Ser/Thr protein kinase
MSGPGERWARIGAIFDEACGLEPAARPAYVADAAAGDTTLAREVLSLLAAHEASGAFLDRPAADLGPVLLGSRPPAFEPGAVLGPYRVLERLGEGGMGVVFLAEDTRLHRRVALKVLDPLHLANAAAQERLRQEARAAARLHHPGIAAVYALEEVDGRPLLATEYIDGQTLRAVIDSGPVQPADAMAMAEQLARALEAAHAQGVVHRDLKPENVMVGRDGRVKVLDFGIARVADRDAGGERLTSEGAVIGTPAYMAPEQLRGDEVDARADQFTFGIVLYEMLSGAHPFAAPGRTATQARILTADPPPLAQAGHPASPALERVVRRCLEKDPARRYAATSMLVRDLVEASAPASQLPWNERQAAAPGADGRQAGTRRWWRVHQWLVMTGVSGLLILDGWVALWVGGAAQYPLFFGLLALGVTATTLRAHLLFVSRYRAPAMAAEWRRAMPWLRALDLAFAAINAGAAVAIGPAHPVASSIVLAAATILAAAVTVIEPATARSAFDPGDAN